MPEVTETCRDTGSLRRQLVDTAAFREAVEGLERLNGTRAFSGVNAAGSALLFSCLLQEAEGLSGFIVCPGHEAAEDVYGACRAFVPESVNVFFFPAMESRSGQERDMAALSARLSLCRQLLRGNEQVLAVAPVQAVLEETPAPEQCQKGTRLLERGAGFDPEGFTASLGSFGFERLPQVEQPGDFARRGGIVDVFPYGRRLPLRLEFDGEELCSLREFNPVTQLSEKEISRAEVLLSASRMEEVLPPREKTILSYFPERLVFAVLEEQEVRDKAIQLGLHAGLSERVSSKRVHDIFNRNRLKLERFSRPGTTVHFPFTRRPPLGNCADTTCTLLKGYLSLGSRCFVISPNSGEELRVRGIVRDKGPELSEGLQFLLGDVREGFMVTGHTALVTSGELLGRKPLRRSAPVPSFSTPSSGFFSIAPGDLVVHVSHGIGRFLHTEWIKRDGAVREYLVIEYRDGVRLFVPAQKADLVTKYVGSGERQPRLDKLHGKSWQRRCEVVEKSVHDFASELLDIQAKRRSSPGFCFPRDDEMQRQLEASFSFEETPDQFEGIEKVKSDMEKTVCMDRLICGDVGYGKTEIAVRAAFKAVCGGKQVALLVPTTVLAEQHYETFRDRLASFPVEIAVLSRFRTRKEQKEILKRLTEGAVDVVIGTHRLLSKDVAFADLGLVIIDEEQRFGVRHKERFKQLRALVEVLTMTATPIPRTLHLSLLGLKDITNLTTPPEGRAAVRTEVCRFEPERARKIILRELDRDGQVYFVHNRVRGLKRIRDRISKIVPEARVEMAHGQLSERRLSETMREFSAGRIDVLVATTIVESGLDIPNVNTLFVSEADRYGLADLHQLRGRVGRYRHQAYAYFLLPEGRRVSVDGEKRLRALESFSELGAGFQLSLKDLELRGAGNILGSQQSGHIAQVGYDMYCRLLKRTVSKMKRERPEELPNVRIGLKLSAFLPEDFVSPGLDRLGVYREVASATGEEELEEVRKKIVDRFGQLPEAAERLFDMQRLRIRLSELGIESVGLEEGRPVFSTTDRFSSACLKYSTFGVRRLEDSLYMIESRLEAPGEISAFRLFLKWSGEMVAGSDKVRSPEGEKVL